MMPTQGTQQSFNHSIMPKFIEQEKGHNQEKDYSMNAGQPLKQKQMVQKYSTEVSQNHSHVGQM